MVDTPEKKDATEEPPKEAETKDDEVTEEPPKEEEPAAAPAPAAADEKEEEKPKPKKETKKKAPAVTTPDTTAAGRSSRGRVRKQVQSFAPAEDVEKTVDIPPGQGTALSEIPNVVANFQSVTWSHPHLKMLYNIVFGVGKKKEFKAHLLAYSGVPAGDDGSTWKDKMQPKVAKLQVSDLKSILDLVDVERGQESFEEKKNPTKEMLETRLMEWLVSPSDSGRSKRKMRTIKGSAGGGAKAKASSSSSSNNSTKKKASSKSAAAKRKSSGAAKKPAAAKKSKKEDIDFDIPGTTIEQVRTKVKSIVEKADQESVTVKTVRKELEDWLDADLTEHKDAVRALVMEAME